MITESTATPDLSILLEPRVRQFMEEAQDALARSTNGYVTLALLQSGGGERQIGRLSRDGHAALESWLRLQLGCVSGPGRHSFRLRLWGNGGQAQGGIVLAVECVEQRVQPVEAASTASTSVPTMPSRTSTPSTGASMPSRSPSSASIPTSRASTTASTASTDLSGHLQTVARDLVALKKEVSDRTGKMIWLEDQLDDLHTNFNSLEKEVRRMLKEHADLIEVVRIIASKQDALIESFITVANAK